MNSIALSRNWLLILGSLLVFFAVAMRSGTPVAPTLKTSGVSLQEAISLIDSGALVIDVRASATTHLPGALLIPLEVLAARLSKMEVAKTQPIVVYCGNGNTRGPKAANILSQAGFQHVVNLQPGIEGWRAARLPVVAG
jgi:rhodanese-related sulfurtransferase